MAKPLHELIAEKYPKFVKHPGDYRATGNGSHPLKFWVEATDFDDMVEQLEFLYRRRSAAENSLDTMNQDLAVYRRENRQLRARLARFEENDLAEHGV